MRPAVTGEAPVPAPSLTIDDVLSEFLAEQEQRLAPRTFGNYAAVVDLLRACLNGYGHLSLDGERGYLDEAVAKTAAR